MILPYQRTLNNPVATGYTRSVPPLNIPDEVFQSIPGLAGLGLDTSSLPSGEQIDVILNDTSGGGSGFIQIIENFLATFGIGAGRREADIIVPVQNRLLYNLGLITDQFRVGMSPSLGTLQSLRSQVLTLTNNFVVFVLNRRFTDRRASGQALNTVMPYVDGSCGYAVPLGMTATPSQFNCISWGDGQLGGVGTNGMLGALGRAIVSMGGSAGGGVITNPGTGGGGLTTMGISTPMLVAGGILLLFLFRRKF